MAAVLLNTCGQCERPGLFQSQVRAVIVNGVEIYQCEEGFIKKDNGGQKLSANQWRKIVGESNGYYVADYTAYDRKNGVQVSKVHIGNSSWWMVTSSVGNKMMVQNENLASGSKPSRWER
eukprot:5516496-Karenia_brevis.AAC.1